MDTGSYFSVAGDLLGGVSSFLGGNSAAKIYNNNATLAETKGTISQGNTALQLQRQKRTFEQTQGGAIADAGANGLASSGSALDVIRANAQDSALDRLLITSQGQMDKLGFATEANNARAQASSAKSSGGGGLFGSILSAVGTVAAFL